jgi:predicted GNAT family acetyltransferase
VGRVSGELLAHDRQVEVCTLFTQLSNPTSNAVYRRLGYEAVSEITRYDFQAQHEGGGAC